MVDRTARRALDAARGMKSRSTKGSSTQRSDRRRHQRHQCDGVDAPPGGIAMCQAGDVQIAREEEASMKEVTIVGVDHHRRGRPGKAGVPVARRGGGRHRRLPQEAVAGAVSAVSGGAAGLHRGHGGLRDRAPLGPRDRTARPQGPPDPAGLRQAVRQAPEERHGRCRSDRGSRSPADHALRCGEDRSAAGAGDDLPGPGPPGASAHAAEQRVARASRRVRRRRGAGHGPAQAAGGGPGDVSGSAVGGPRGRGHVS